MAQQRGQMTYKGPGKWLLRIYRGRINGKRTYSARMFAGTTNQARQALTQMLREKDTHLFVPSAKTTVQEYLQGWIKVKRDVSPKTLLSYEDQLAQVLPTLGSVRLTDLEPQHIRTLVSALIDAPYAPQTVKYTLRVLRQALNDAVADGVLAKNPCTRKIQGPPEVKRAPTVLSTAQVQAFLTATATHRLGPLFDVLLGTGMRTQEALALKWSDLDLTGHWVTIQRSLVGDGHGRATLQERVKANSQRRLGLPPTTSQVLKAHRQRQLAEILKAGKRYVRQDVVFADESGQPLEMRWVRLQFYAALKAAGLPAMRLYDTRATHATTLLQAGMDISYVSKRLGHANISTTLAHYAHILPESHRQMGDFVEQLYHGKAAPLEIAK